VRKDLKYIVFLSCTIILFIVIEIITPKPIDWTVSLASSDKNPFGAYLLDKRLGDIFPGSSRSYQTLYELKDSSYQNIFILAQSFAPGDEDTKFLLENVYSGQNVFVASSRFGGLFSDTLSVKTTDYLFDGNIFENLDKEDTTSLHLLAENLRQESYYYQRDNAKNYFSNFDTTKTQIKGVNDLKKPTFLKVSYGEGSIYLCSTPLVFTNNYLVYNDNQRYISHLLSVLPEKDLHWTEYYQLGRMEAQSPLRYILQETSLKWAYYITIIALLLYLVFEGKRKQRIIPVIEPLKNDTLDFVGTISNLYYQKKSHKSIAEKKINFFMERLRQKFYLNIREDDKSFIDKIAEKTGNDLEDVKKLFDLINQIKVQSQLSEDQLMDLNKKIEDFKA